MTANILSLPFMVTFTFVTKFGDKVGKSFNAVCMSVAVEVDVERITCLFLKEINYIILLFTK